MIDYEDDETCLVIGCDRKYHKYNYRTHVAVEYRKKTGKRYEKNRTDAR